MQPNSKFLLNMETKDELLSEGEKYFEKVMQDFNHNRKGRNLRKYCNKNHRQYSTSYHVCIVCREKRFSNIANTKEIRN